MLRREEASEDIAPSLGQIQEPFNTGLKASNDSADEGKPLQPEKDNDTSALEEYLASRLQQIGEVPTQQKEVKGLRTGNGWDANKVIEQVYKIEPISIKRAIEIAVTSNRTLKERLLRLFRRRQEQGNIIGSPTVEFVPIWKVKGFHECYYLRSNSYKVNLRNDVVGVELEGKGRDLILEKKHLRFIPSAIVDRFQRLSSFMTNESKYFVITDVTELATKRSEAELVISAGGRSLNEEEEMMLTSWRTKRIFDTSDLKVRGAAIKVREPAFSKEFTLERFRERVVRMPERFKQILSNKLQITELRRIYIPFIKVPIQKGLVPRDVMINGTSGEPADKGLLELLE
jgi:hypothetical protein